MSRLRAMSATLIAGLALLLAGCVSVDLPEGSFLSRASLGPTSERLADRIRACWFASDEAAFSDFRQETEITSLSGQPRIILVNRNERGGLPQLVVTIRDVSRTGTVVSAFGPLTNGPLKARINGDIERWARGSRDCGATG
jgi:hypothetical protein